MVIEYEKSLLSKLSGEFVVPSQERIFREYTEGERFIRLRVIWMMACFFFLFLVFLTFSPSPITSRLLHCVWGFLRSDLRLLD